MGASSAIDSKEKLVRWISVGAALATIFGAGWAVFAYLKPPEPAAKPNTPNVTAIGGGVAVGGSGSSTFYIYAQPMNSAGRPTANSGQTIDPQKELASRGLAWNSNDFSDSLKRKDVPNLKLYMAGGMTITARQFRLLFYRSFDGHQKFNAAIANLVTERNAIPHDVCPVPEIVNSPDIPLFTKGAYTGDYDRIHLPDLYEEVETSNDADELNFIKRICNQPDVIASIDKIASISKQQRSYIAEVKVDIGRWRHVRKLLSGVEPSW
jgi:hypothetical protein